jgi:hypothetical protein
VDHDTEEVLGYTVMPTYQEGSKTEVFVAGVLDFIYKYNADKILVAIEEPLKHAKSSQAVRSMAISFGKCVGACDAIHVPVCRIQVKDWQDAVLGKGLAKGNTKVKALAVASKRWPEQDWLATSRSKVPHDGIIDAALIAYYVASLPNIILP